MPTTPTTSLFDLVAIIAAHHWLPLIAFVALYARKLASDESAFPLTISKEWRATISAAGGLVYGLVGALQSGSTLGVAVLGAVVAAGSAGFLDGMLTAIFNHNNAPTWARWLVGVFDDITTGGGSSMKKTTTTTTTATVVEIHPPQVSSGGAPSKPTMLPPVNPPPLPPSAA